MLIEFIVVLMIFLGSRTALLLSLSNYQNTLRKESHSLDYQLSLRRGQKRVQLVQDVSFIYLIGIGISQSILLLMELL